jgi:hypothetical protein
LNCSKSALLIPIGVLDVVILEKLSLILEILKIIQRVFHIIRRVSFIYRRVYRFRQQKAISIPSSPNKEPRVHSCYIKGPFKKGKKISPTGTYFVSAITSISTFASFGSRATSTQERAGLCSLKYSAYTSLISANSFMSLIKTVAFTT